MTVSSINADVDLLRLHELNPNRYPFLLESSGEHPTTGRFDILFGFPGEALVLDAEGLKGPHPAGGSFLAALDAWFRLETTGRSENAALPFVGGWFLYLGYELLAEIEPSVQVFPDTDLPRAMAVRCPAALIRDRGKNLAYLVTDDDGDTIASRIMADLAAIGSNDVSKPVAIGAAKITEETPGKYIEAVGRAKSYIREGDVFQANLSREWRAQLNARVSDADLYRALRNANPAPFSGLCRWEQSTIISSSPERLVACRGNKVETRPIAGTRRRSDVEIEDERLSEELLSHPKEQAEHVMLVDLERNDVGRIARTGTVKVDEFMVLESYAHVHHIVSSVSGVIDDDVLPGEIIGAVFPGGTITGCPKVRCMEIISELEQGARGAYTGSMGYLGLDGSMDLNILIRTMVRTADQLKFRAGAGIVADSIPENELEETRIKARGLIEAIA